MGRNFGHRETLKWVYVSCSAMSWLCNGWGYSPLPRGRVSGEGRCLCSCLCWSRGGVDPPLLGLTWKPSDSLRGRASAGTGRLKWIKIQIGTFSHFPVKRLVLSGATLPVFCPLWMGLPTLQISLGHGASRRGPLLAHIVGTEVWTP